MLIQITFILSFVEHENRIDLNFLRIELRKTFLLRFPMYVKHPVDYRSCFPASVEDLSLTDFLRPVVQTHEYRHPEFLELSICCGQWFAHRPPS